MLCAHLAQVACSCSLKQEYVQTCSGPWTVHKKIHLGIFLSLLWCQTAPQWFFSGSGEVDQRLIDYMKVMYTRMFLFFVFFFHIYAWYFFFFFGGWGVPDTVDCNTTKIRQQDGECHSWTVTFLATQIVFRQLAGLACGAAGRREKGLTLTRWWGTYRHLPKPRHPFVIVNWFPSPACLLEQDRSSN